jgi:hypothetical protein
VATDGKKSETGDYSATKAPENAEHVESKARNRNDTLKPGGAHGATAAVGMTALDRDSVPNGATDPHQTDYGSLALLEDDGSDRSQV